MSATERLDQIEQRARTYSGLGYPHDGDCAGSLCTSCGHCLHSVDECSCADCGCFDYVDDDEVLMKRDALALIAALRAALAQCDRWDAAGKDEGWGGLIRAAITSALDEPR